MAERHVRKGDGPVRSIDEANLTSHPEGRGLTYSAEYIVSNRALQRINAKRKEEGKGPFTKEDCLREWVRGEVFLDLGTSVSAALPRDLVGIAKKVHGISPELTPDEIKDIETNCPECHVAVGEANKLPYPDNTFGRIAGVEVVRYFKEDAKYDEARKYFLQAIAEIYRVLKPGGEAVLCPVDGRAGGFSRKTLLGRKHIAGHLTEAELQKMPPGFEYELLDDGYTKLVQGFGSAKLSGFIIRKPGRSDSSKEQYV